MSVIAPEKIEPGMVVEYRQSESMKPERGRVVQVLPSETMASVDFGEQRPRPVSLSRLYSVDSW
jgi:hypothetical protein